MLTNLLFATWSFGGIYGDLRLGDKYLAEVKVTLTCGAATAEATTDAKGSFRVTVQGEGKCRVGVSYEGQTPSVEVVVFEKPARYRLVLEQIEGKYVLKRV
ncbi:MAG TPA: hypothetical protein VF862_12625 [Gemmatimonadales bacterium]